MMSNQSSTLKFQRASRTWTTTSIWMPLPRSHSTSRILALDTIWKISEEPLSGEDGLETSSVFWIGSSSSLPPSCWFWPSSSLDLWSHQSWPREKKPRFSSLESMSSSHSFWLWLQSSDLPCTTSFSDTTLPDMLIPSTPSRLRPALLIPRESTSLSRTSTVTRRESSPNTEPSSAGGSGLLLSIMFSGLSLTRFWNNESPSFYFPKKNDMNQKIIAIEFLILDHFLLCWEGKKKNIPQESSS